MGFFDFDQARDARDAVYSPQEYNDDHRAKFSHELVGGAAAFEAMHVWEKERQAEGKPMSHGFAREALAAMAGAEADKLFETKGLDFVDREEAKRHAKRQAEELYDRQYGGMENCDPGCEPHHSMRGERY
ncbi:hypothetical protein B0T16DRAFT_324020 [Cercophora newfieldiana]|uniref:CipC-like antibiotic response protein n=1 Tax=Cercophora newfieldiana TaxID=92897 RepID=A0AA40CWF6_9PEZI|nr:hypothetical protein B0T16DRAFT_324020 [Cercophora newfieldiana]